MKFLRVARHESCDKMEDMVKKLVFTKNTNTYTCSSEFKVTYPCACCSDRFAIKSSYLRHINRASVKITLFCKQCNTKLFFTNRCMMFLHIESHKIKDFTYSLSDFTIEPLPIEMMKTNLITGHTHRGNDLLKKYKVVSSKEECKENTISNTDNSSETQASEPISNNPVDIVSVHPIDIVSVHPVDIVSVHPVDIVSVDSVDLISANPVDPPLVDLVDVAPIDPNDTCPVCSLKFKGNTQKYIEMLRSQHCQRIDDSEFFDHTCYKCKRILPNKCSLVAHQKLHMKETPFMCPECGLIFPDGEMLDRHVTFVCFHYSRIMYVNCVFDSCSSSFREQEIQTHFKKHIKFFLNCRLCTLEFETSDDLRSHYQLLHEDELILSIGIYLCNVCKGKFTKENIYGHVVDHFSHATKVKYIYVCPGCKHFVMNIRQLKKHASKCMPYKQNMHSFEFHKNIFPLGNRKMECKTFREADFDYNMENSEIVDDPNNPNSPDSEAENVDVGSGRDETTIPVTTESILSPEIVQQKPKKKRKIQYKKRLNLNTSKLDPYTPRVYNCSLCVFKTTNNTIFSRHIITHHDESTSYQCMECGLCFTYKAAFGNHLEIKHDIDDVESYIETKKCFIKKENKSKYPARKRRKRQVVEEDKEEVPSNQCPECMEIFDNSVELDKHFRSHGMAFLMKKKR